MCQNEVVAISNEGAVRGEAYPNWYGHVEASLSAAWCERSGGAGASPEVRRKEMVAFFQRLEPTVVGIEACGGAHHWARVLQEFGHRVKLLPPKYAKAYVKRGKNDAADAEALCEAMSRPTMRFVAAKTAEQQAAQMLAGTRDRLIRRRTQLTNAIRGYAAEFGLIAARGVDKIAPLLARLHSEPTLPALARELFAGHAKEYAQLQAQLRRSTPS